MSGRDPSYRIELLEDDATSVVRFEGMCPFLVLNVRLRTNKARTHQISHLVTFTYGWLPSCFEMIELVSDWRTFLSKFGP